MNCKNYEVNGCGHKLDLFIISHKLCVSNLTRSEYKEENQMTFEILKYELGTSTLGHDRWEGPYTSWTHQGNTIGPLHQILFCGG